MEELQALLKLVEAGWGRDDASYRHMFAMQFAPGATMEQINSLSELQRRASTAENTVRILQAFFDVDVTHRAREVRCPTLIMHAREDQRHGGTAVPASGRTFRSIPGRRTHALAPPPEHRLLNAGGARAQSDETTMGARDEMQTDETIRIDATHGAGIRIASGSVWLTRYDDSTDHVLRSGDTMGLGTRGPALITALEPTMLELCRADPVALRHRVEREAHRERRELMWRLLRRAFAWRRVNACRVRGCAQLRLF